MNNKEIKVFLSEEDHKKIKEESQANRLSMSGYIRELIKSRGVIKENSPPEAREVYLDLAEIQQRLEAMSAGKESQDIESLLEDVRKLRAKSIGMGAEQ